MENRGWYSPGRPGKNTGGKLLYSGPTGDLDFSTYTPWLSKAKNGDPTDMGHRFFGFGCCLVVEL